jgi:hypothetical protein
LTNPGTGSILATAIGMASAGPLDGELPRKRPPQGRSLAMHAATEPTSVEAVRFRRLLHRTKATQADYRFLLEALADLPFWDLLRATDVHGDLGDPGAVLSLLQAKLPRDMDPLDAVLGWGRRLVAGPSVETVSALLDRVGPELEPNTLRHLRRRLRERVAPSREASAVTTARPAAPTLAPCDPCLERAREGTGERLREALSCKRPTATNEASFYELVCGRFHDSPTPGIACVLGELLRSANGWEKRGPGFVLHTLRRKEARSILALATGNLFAPYDTFYARLEDPRLVGAIHLAVARGLLAWAEERRSAPDNADVVAALRAIAHLDPPRHFVRELARFRRLSAHPVEVREWLERVDAFAREDAGEDACMAAVEDAVTSLGPERGALP